MTLTAICHDEARRVLGQLRQVRPLVHCMTNDVVQQITANVLLAAGASPAMVMSEQESKTFAGIANALLVNIGTLTTPRFNAMKLGVEGAIAAGRPWVLDPVAAGCLSWRDACVQELVAMKPTVIRGNASEILAIAGQGAGGKGVDSLNTSNEALDVAQAFARRTGSVICVTGETDYITDGERTLTVSGGHVMATLVVGTGCSLSALVAAFCAVEKDYVLATATAALLAKRAAEYAHQKAQAPGSFHTYYIDGLYEINTQTL